MTCRTWFFRAVVTAGLLALAGNAVAAPRTGTPAAERAYTYRLEIEGMTPGNFASVSGLGSTTEVVEFREGGDTGATRKVPGETTFHDIIIGADATNPLLDELWAWRQQIIEGTLVRKNGSIIILDQNGSEVVRYDFQGAWPSQWKGFTLAGKGSAVGTEEVVFVAEFIERRS